MALDNSQLNTLKRPFARADHEFVRGFVYLTEEAVTTRLEEVDPSWEFAVLQMTQSGSQVVCHARMTVCGVFRDGVGMQAVIEKAGEAEKGAATDALKRCARLFGVGRYLLDAPKEDAFNAWLAQQQKALQAPQTPSKDAEPTQRPPAPQNGAGGAQKPPLASTPPTDTTAKVDGGSSAGAEFFPPEAVVLPLNTEGDSDHLPRDVNGMPILGSLDMKVIGKQAQGEGLVKGQYHFANLIDLLWRDGAIRAASSTASVLDAIRKHHEAKSEPEGVGAR